MKIKPLIRTLTSHGILAGTGIAFALSEPIQPIAPADSDRRELIEWLPVTLDEFSLALTHPGLGISDVMQKKSTPKRT